MVALLLPLALPWEICTVSLLFLAAVALHPAFGCSQFSGPFASTALALCLTVVFGPQLSRTFVAFHLCIGLHPYCILILLCYYYLLHVSASPHTAYTGIICRTASHHLYACPTIAEIAL